MTSTIRPLGAPDAPAPTAIVPSNARTVAIVGPRSRSILSLYAALGLWVLAALPAFAGQLGPILVIDLAVLGGLVGLTVAARSAPTSNRHAAIPSRPWLTRTLGRGSVSTVLPSAAMAVAALGVLAVVLIGIGATASSNGVTPGTTSSIRALGGHWLAATIVTPIVVAATWLVRRSSPGGPAPALAATGLALYAVELLTGVAAAGTDGSWWVVASHLWIGAAAWACLVGATMASVLEWPAREPTRLGSSAVAPWSVRARAYVALTKPRIIELLLVTTVPAMLLAARDVPVGPASLAWLVGWTLVGGTLAAGSANAMNCYLDRDIDKLMTRTQRRPLPAHDVSPDHALLFGLALGVASFALLLVFVNLLAAVLTLLAIAFYVVIYTVLLKRSTPQNIVIGGAAGALPPVIGWTAVTGTLSAVPLLLFLIVFYWTPPHFWALSIRLRRDYAAAGVPMLPVVHGIPDTNRQILLYSILLVALTAALVPIGQMGAVYTVGAALAGAWFLREVWVLWRDGTAARAIRVYKCSITYLSALFAVIALDAIWTLRP